MEEPTAEQIEEIKAKLRDPNTPLFQGGDANGIISDRTANYLVVLVLFLFVMGAFFVPNDWSTMW